MKRRKLKPREYAARLVSGEFKLADVPEGLRCWCISHITCMAKQLQRTKANG